MITSYDIYDYKFITFGRPSAVSGVVRRTYGFFSGVIFRSLYTCVVHLYNIFVYTVKWKVSFRNNNNKF